MNYGITECGDIRIATKHQFKRDYIHCSQIFFFAAKVLCAIAIDFIMDFFFLVWLRTDFIFIYELTNGHETRTQTED